MWFRPEPMHKHKECKHFDLRYSRCIARHCIVTLNEIACKIFDPKVVSSYERFACAHCGAHGPKWNASRVQTVFFENGNDAWVFKCGDCDKLTIIYQDEGHQRVKVFEPGQTQFGQLKLVASNSS